MGPLVFGFAVFDGFQHTLTVWLARYVNIFMWLPVANIFGAILGKIQQNMLKIDLSQIAAQGDTFFSPYDAAYLCFMVIGIVGYFTVPNVAGYIVNAGGGNAMLQKINTLVVSGGNSVYSAASGMFSGGGSSGGSGGGMSADAYGDNYRLQRSGQTVDNDQGDYFKDKLSGKGGQS